MIRNNVKENSKMLDKLIFKNQKWFKLIFVVNKILVNLRMSVMDKRMVK